MLAPGSIHESRVAEDEVEVRSRLRLRSSDESIRLQNIVVLVQKGQQRGPRTSPSIAASGG
jgi:hypothetical protein